MKLFISPHPDSAPYGIKRVVEAMYKHLPSYGIELVATEAEADVVNVHATAFVDTKKPVVYSSHGLYWGEMPWSHEYLRINQAMIDYMARSQAVTAVSEWVAHSISRAMLVKPHVIYHGVDTDEWRPGKVKQGYVLWNKARADVVSNPEDMQRLAMLLPDVPFVTTIGKPAANVQVTGTVTHSQMRDMVQKAGVYLCTARETMGIGTLEAMACGVPVVGWDWGGQSEIKSVDSGGMWLVRPGDYGALADAVKEALASKEAGGSARETAVNHWGWVSDDWRTDRMLQYADVFKQVHKEALVAVPAVSVIVTCHNLAKYLPDALKSVKGQTLKDWECIIVDDASEDETFGVATRFMQPDERFSYLPTPHNLKLSGARNFGAEQANGRYLLFLDADDMLAPNALAMLVQALDDNPSIHIAYGHLDVVNEAGEGQRRNDWPFEQFSWEGQMSHLNQLPYASMMRREVWERSGGYRLRDWRAEDSSFWCRVTSLGFRAAKVTQDSMLIYRQRGDSKSVQERQAGHDDGDWTQWYPWRMAGSVEEGIKVVNARKRPNETVVPAGAQGRNQQKGCWPVWSHHDPIVSIIIPVGPGHEGYLIDALDSVQSQSFPFWEAVVVNDTGRPLETPYAPWAKIVGNGDHSIASSRNLGITAARAPLVLFLDADDVLLPYALHDMLKGYVEHDGARYIYGDWLAVGNGKKERKNSKDYDRNHLAKEGIHPVTILVDKAWCDEIGGYDEEIPGWEDWDFHVKLAVTGHCGHRIGVPTMVYRMHGGQRREQSLADAGKTLPILKERYGHFFDGGKAMAGCCGGNGDVIISAKQRLNLLDRPKGEPTVSNGLVRVEFAGDRKGSITYKSVMGQKLSRAYKLGSSALNKYADATPEDARLLVEAEICRYVKEQTIDLAQVDRVSVDITPQVTAVSEPEPVETADLAAISEGNLTDFRQSLLNLSKDELGELLAMERGKDTPRKSAVRLLKATISDMERVAAG